MRKILFLVFAIFLLCSHDLYLKMDSYFLDVNQEAVVSLYNGTFEKSENIITRNRIQDASIVINGKRKAIDSTQWIDKDTTITQLVFTPQKEGTYLAGVSTKPRNIALSADKFNSYLEHDGVLDMLEARKRQDLLEEDAVESYQKHVKAIYQVGKAKTQDWSAVLGYPIEFVPKVNPYEKYSGESLALQLLLDGKPLPNQLVYADYLQPKNSHSHESEAHSHEHGESTHSHDNAKQEEHSHTSGQQLRTNEEGIVEVQLPEDGIYYVRTIYMTSVDNHEELTHESKWATLTFEVTHKHGSDTHTHDEDHHHESSFPKWIFILGSVVLVGILFFVFRKKS
ncbi:DUF4198 domain-containing protein [Croceivirga lutea]|uniref:DUF4198 domain-containing protein n=1 Tax=Croceivirga lutea TaxID=1775167 RepID=UPI0016397E68|nr:DUF4198 domain-containing protein [Croceivirga lutea]